MNWTTLVSTDALAAQIGHPDLVIVDCRFALDDIGWGERSYATAHIPGARYAHLDRDLSGPKNGRNGRHPLPRQDAIVETFARLGISNGKQVVAYDQDAAMFASRLWWLLRWAGHRGVAVLDGGFAKWARERRPATSGVKQPPEPATFVARFDETLRADAAAVEQAMEQPAQTLIDARAPERFRGDVEPLDAVAGHIPGAVNHPYRQNADAEGVFLTRAALRDAFERTLAGTSPAQAICYCGSGVTACQNLLAMNYAGLPGAKLYPGSWSEWASEPARPVERGPRNPR
jgi:thiosulfate/3-mercaptopyruvate sulfurtransferase